MTEREFRRCVENGRLVRIEPNPRMISEELESARYDISRAEISFRDGDFKWATTQGYYCLFHSAKALVLHKGYREKSHHCLIVALEALYVVTGEIPSSAAQNLDWGMEMRHDADYRGAYDDEGARLCIEAARSLLDLATSICSNDRGGGRTR